MQRCFHNFLVDAVQKSQINEAENVKFSTHFIFNSILNSYSLVNTDVSTKNDKKSKAVNILNLSIVIGPFQIEIVRMVILHIKVLV